MPELPGFGWSATSLRTWCIIGVNSGLGTDPSTGACPPDLDPSVDPVFDVIQCQGEFEINTIPSCVVLLALGRRTDDVNVAAQVHSTINKMTTLLPFELWVQASSAAGDPGPERWPKNPFRIFRGYANGGGLRKTTQGVEFSLACTHWLTDLNFSSSVSRSTHPLNPAQLSYLGNILWVNGAGALSQNMIAATIGAQYFGPEVISKDFWAAKMPGPNGNVLTGIKGIFSDLCLQNRLQFIPSPLGPLIGQNPEERNIEALCALNRFEPVDNNYQYGVPLAFNTDTVVQSSVISPAIANDIATLTLDNLAGYTIWDKLMELSSVYQFAVIPMVNRALVVPFTPGLNKGYWRTIYSTTYDRIERPTTMVRPLRGVCLYVGRGAGIAGGDGNVYASPLPGDRVAGACWEADRTNPFLRKGMVIYKEAPRWLQCILPSNGQPPPSSGFATAVTPTIPGLVLAAINAAKAAAHYVEPAEALIQINPVLRRYARMLYMTEVLRGRQGHVSGKLRFDIAPGSHVRVQGSEDPFLAGKDNDFEEVMYGMVVKVSYTINSETGSAGTSFHLAFVRTQAENGRDATSLDANPLWNGADSQWLGAPLVTDSPIGLLTDPGDPGAMPGPIVVCDTCLGPPGTALDVEETN